VNKTTRGVFILAGILVATAVFCLWIPFSVLPGAGIGVALPVIFVPGEILVRDFFGEGVHLTNTLVGMFLTDIVVLLMLAGLYLSGGVKAIPSRIQGLLELLVEYMYNLAKSVAGSRAARVFPLVMGIFLFLLVANWLELVPGVDSVGLLHCAEPGFNGYPINEPSTVLGAETYSLRVESPLNAGTKATLDDFCACEVAHAGHIPDDYVSQCEAIGYTVEHEADGEHAEDAAHAEDEAAPEEEAVVEEEVAEAEAGAETEMVSAEANPDLFVVTPFVRAAATDLNLTVALAIIAVVAVQVFGVWELGPDYFQKFFNLRALGGVAQKPMGLMDFAVGLLEIVSEFSRVLSFAFRLFGNIFGGQVLLFVMAFLVATMLPVIFYAFELFVGLIQAFVFAMLTLAFSAQAMAGHGDGHDH
jgi:F-type H+-transporting ATPase subunit a